MPGLQLVGVQEAAVAELGLEAGFPSIAVRTGYVAVSVLCSAGVVLSICIAITWIGENSAAQTSSFPPTVQVSSATTSSGGDSAAKTPPARPESRAAAGAVWSGSSCGSGVGGGEHPNPHHGAAGGEGHHDPYSS